MGIFDWFFGKKKTTSESTFEEKKEDLKPEPTMEKNWILKLNSTDLGTVSICEDLYKLNLNNFSFHEFSQLKDLINDDSKVTVTLEVYWEGNITTINTDGEKSFHEGETYSKTIIVNLHNEEHWNINWFKELVGDENELDPISFLNETYSSIDFDEHDYGKIIEDESYGPEEILKFEIEIISKLDVEKVKNWFLHYYNDMGDYCVDDLKEDGKKFLGI